MSSSSADRIQIAAAAPVRVLIVEDDTDHRVLLTRSLVRHHPPFDVTSVAGAEECWRALDADPYGVILLDYSLPGTNGLAVLAELRRRGVDMPVLMITGQGDERIAVAAMNSGAADYVIKTPGYLATIPTVVLKVLKQHELARQNVLLYQETQARLRELQAAQDRLVRVETLRALGELASGTAHHLNNLLAVVVGRVELLLAGERDRADRPQLEIIRRAARDGADVVRRVQEFARTNQLDRRALDLNELAREVVEMTRGRWHDAAHAQGITIEVELALGTVPPVLGHAASLREVLTNLIINAVDALPAGGRIRVATCVDGEMVALTVSDDGIGMSADVLRRAQEPFFTTKGVKSTGLGLAVNYGIMERHRGDLVIESCERRGTRITIRVPPAGSSARSPREPTPRRASAPSLRILVVDDEAEVRETFVELIRSRGHVVREADSARAALSALEAGEPPHVLVTDFGMPGMTGGDLATEVRRRWPRIKIALVTGWDAAPVEGARCRENVDILLGKPLVLEDLNEFLATVLEPDIAGAA